MKVYHIGVVSFDNVKAKRELKSVGGIQGYILDLITFSLEKNNDISLIGKVYNYKKIARFEYFEIQKTLTSTNKFLLYLFLSSFRINIPKNAIVHAHRPDHLAAFSFFKKYRSVISLHGQQSKTVNDRKGFLVRSIYNFLEMKALKSCNSLIAVDQKTKDYYSNNFPKHAHKIHVIPTGVDTKIFRPLSQTDFRKEMGFSSSQKVVLYVGRIEPPKKVDDIIKAFRIIYKSDESYRLLIVGDGVLFDEMKKLVLDLGLEGKVVFTGIRKRIELPLIFNISNVSVLYSGNEGSPLSIKESLACGVPVVANKVGDVTTVIRDDYNGYIVEEESIEALASKIKLAVENGANLKQNCLDSISDYTVEKVNNKVLELYKSL